MKKSQNGGSVHIFHQIWPNYRVNLLIFWFFLGGGGQKIFSKNVSREGDLGGIIENSIFRSCILLTVPKIKSKRPIGLCLMLLEYPLRSLVEVNQAIISLVV